MLTIQFNKGINLFLTYTQLNAILNNNPNLKEYLKDYSFESPNTLFNLIQDNNKLIIYYHQDIPENFDMLNPRHFEIILKCLEQLLIYQRDFPLLQMDFYPDNKLTIYTYSQVWEADFDKFTETPYEEYTWDNLPNALFTPNSNMLVKQYNPLTHIAIVYHYYIL